jgi:DNA-binding response OmpR family regulator
VAIAARPPTVPGTRRARPAWLAFADGNLGRALSTASASRVIVATTAREFADLLADARPSVVIVVVPPAGPSELLAVAAQRRLHVTTRAVLLAPARDVATRLDALDRGFDDALPASIDPAELVGRIERLLLPRLPGEPASPVRIDDHLVLDVGARELLCDGSPVGLRPREFALLWALVAEPHRVHSRRELLDRAWGPDFRGDERTVDVHVRWLRSKIEDDPARPRRLLTARRSGYRFEPLSGASRGLRR